MLPFLLPLLKPIMGGILDRIPNPNERMQAKEAVERQMVDAITDATAMQAKINLEEAKHKSLWVAGWRPFVGWVCGAGFAWTFIFQPIVGTITAIWAPDVVMPAIDISVLMQLMLGMLGMGGLRTFEKFKGVARETSPKVK